MIKSFGSKFILSNNLFTSNNDIEIEIILTYDYIFHRIPSCIPWNHDNENESVSPLLKSYQATMEFELLINGTALRDCK